jgi:hypothetical protein
VSVERSRGRLFLAIFQLVLGLFALYVGAVESRRLIIAVGVINVAIGIRSLMLYRHGRR